MPVSKPAAETTERNGTGGSPFGGLSIDFSRDTTVGAPTAPAPLPEIAYDSPAVMTIPGGPGQTAAGKGRTDTKLLIVGSGGGRIHPILGRVSHDVLQNASTPVIVVPPEIGARHALHSA